MITTTNTGPETELPGPGSQIEIRTITGMSPIPGIEEIDPGVDTAGITPTTSPRMIGQGAQSDVKVLQRPLTNRRRTRIMERTSWSATTSKRSTSLFKYLQDKQESCCLQNPPSIVF